MAQPEPKRRRSLHAATLLAVVVGTAISALPAPASDTVNGLTRYCSACWRNARLPVDVWSDCTQEVFVRLLERIPADAWDDALRKEGDERRELLRAIDCVKKRVQRSKTALMYPEDGVADRNDVVEHRRAEDREAIALAAAEVLSERQRQVLRMWADGYDVSDIAQRLEITPARVSDEKYKAVRKLRERLEVETNAA